MITDVSAYNLGILLVLGASALSGISGSLTETAFKDYKRHSIFFSAELAVYGIIGLTVSIFNNIEQRNLIINNGISHLFSNWNYWVLVPVICNAFGGIIVGQVTKYAGGVVKGFALIAGILITGFVEWFRDGKQLGVAEWGAFALVAVSIFIHSKYKIVPTVIVETTKAVKNTKKD